MREFFSFLNSHILPTILMVVGGFIAIGSGLIGAFKIVTLPLPWPAFLVMGLFIFFIAVILLLFAGHKTQTIPNLKASQTPEQQISGVPAGYKQKQIITAPPNPQRQNPNGESQSAKEAKMKLGLAVRDTFYDTTTALTPVICLARDNLQNKFGPGSKTASAIGQGIDSAQGHARAPEIPSLLELQNPDKLREMTLHEAQTAYYYNYCRYTENIHLLSDLLVKAAPYHPSCLNELKGKLDKWWGFHESLLEKNKELGGDLELSTIADIPRAIPALPDMPELSGLIDKPTARDTPLGLALGFMISQHWNADLFDGMKEGKALEGRGNKAFQFIHQAARDGVLLVWGRKSERNAWEKVPPRHWAEYEFDFYSTWHDGTYQGTKDEKINFDNPLSKSTYQDLMVCRAQVEKLWPKGIDS